MNIDNKRNAKTITRKTIKVCPKVLDFLSKIDQNNKSSITNSEHITYIRTRSHLCTDKANAKHAKQKKGAQNCNSEKLIDEANNFVLLEHY